MSKAAGECFTGVTNYLVLQIDICMSSNQHLDSTDTDRAQKLGEVQSGQSIQ